MKIYRYLPDADNYDGLFFQREDFPFKNKFRHGVSISNHVASIKLNEDNVGRQGDFPALSGCIPVFSQKSWNCLSYLISNSVEKYPISTIPSGRKYYIINVVSNINCLNISKSDISLNRATGRVSRIFKYSFNWDILKSEHLFRIPETAGLEVFFSEEFKQVVEEEKLTGLTIKPVVQVD